MEKEKTIKKAFVKRRKTQKLCKYKKNNNKKYKNGRGYNGNSQKILTLLTPDSDDEQKAS